MNGFAVKPSMFIASSADHLDLAYAAQECLEHEVEPTVWNQGVFVLSRPTMSSLIDAVETSDFGLFVFAPSDVTAINENTHKTVRDNVIFELGLFVGRLGQERCFIVMPRGLQDIHLPTDLLGITVAGFDANRQDGNLVAALGPACNKIRTSVRRLGPFVSSSSQDEEPSSPQKKVSSELVSNSDDIIAIIQSWMGSRPADENTNAIFFSEVDSKLNLVPGSAEQHIEMAAKKWGYIVERRGEKTILFRDQEPSFY